MPIWPMRFHTRTERRMQGVTCSAPPIVGSFWGGSGGSGGQQPGAGIRHPLGHERMMGYGIYAAVINTLKGGDIAHFVPGRGDVIGSRSVYRIASGVWYAVWYHREVSSIRDVLCV